MPYEPDCAFRADLNQFVELCQLMRFTPCQTYTWFKQHYGIGDTPWLRTLRDAARYLDPALDESSSPA